MTHEQKGATQAMLRVYNAIKALQDTAIDVKAIYFSELAGEQREIITAAIDFSYADTAKTRKDRRCDIF